MFKDKLNEILNTLNISQTQLSNLTGIGKSSISQYCAGKNVPTIQRQRDIAIALGLEEDFFEHERDVDPMKTAKIQRLLPSEVAKLMGLAERTVREGLRDGVFPWGYAIRGKGDKWVYFINAKRFAEIEGL